MGITAFFSIPAGLSDSPQHQKLLMQQAQNNQTQNTQQQRCIATSLASIL
jgi:hypothetical protein